MGLGGYAVGHRDESMAVGESRGLEAAGGPATPGFGRSRVRWANPFDALVVLLFGVAVLPAALELFELWGERPEYSHGYLMVPAAIWLLWQQRAALRALPTGASVTGALALAFGLTVLLAGMMLTWPVMAVYGLVLGAAGLVWALWGPAALRLAIPSLVALALACPLPGRIQEAVTLPLKRTASLLATGLLDLSGIPAALEGNLIHLSGADDLWIADACSGINSLISLLALVVLGALLFRPRVWLVLVLLASCVPIAVLVNALRIWLTGVLSVRVGPEAAQGFFHTFEGFGLFLVAAILLWGWASLLGRLWPDRSPEGDSQEQAAC